MCAARWIEIDYVKSNRNCDLAYGLLKNSANTSTKMAVGRIPANSEKDAKAVIKKIIDYEKKVIEEDSFYNSSLMAINNQLFSGSIGIKNQILNILKTTGNTTKIVDNLDSGDELSNYFNSISGWLALYNGHGSTGAWEGPDFSKSDAKSLTNGDKIPLIFTTSCQTANITYTGSVGEAVVANPNGGAIGYIGFSYLVPASYIEHQKNAIKAMLSPDSGVAIHTVGDAVFSEMVETSPIYYGSPTTRIWTEKPTEIIATYSKTFDPNKDYIVSDLNISSNAIIEGCAITLYSEDMDKIIESAPITSTVSKITFGSDASSCNTLILTITAPNYLALIDTINKGAVTIVKTDNTNIRNRCMVFHNENRINIVLPKDVTPLKIRNAEVKLFTPNGKFVKIFKIKATHQRGYSFSSNNISNGVYIVQFKMGDKLVYSKPLLIK